jgi:glyoxylase-like metal-dependent hydrolase (beta-lactamase superfamily II)
MTITLKHFPAGEGGFFRAPVLLSGARQAILVDGGFTLDDGRAVAAAIQATGKQLTTIYVSQADPDYYFSLRPIREAFPDARVIAGADTVAAISASVQKKLDAWSPKLGANGPRTLSDVVLPTASDDRTLRLDDEEIEIVAHGLTKRRYLWVPSLRAVVGGVLVFSGVHVWTADTQRPEHRAAWVADLDALAKRDPKIVMPGHLAEGAACDASAIGYTREYLTAFEEEVARAANGGALIAAMKRRYPRAGMGVALDIGARVAKGEMKWP